MKELLRISISEARARLPELAQRAMASPDAVIVIEHRDYSENLVLTTEGHLRMLEALMEKSTTKRNAPFKLAGSMTSDLTDEELEKAIETARAEAHAAAEARLERLAKELE
jgi:hypothetical protein